MAAVDTLPPEAAAVDAATMAAADLIKAEAGAASPVHNGALKAAREVSVDEAMATARSAAFAADVTTIGAAIIGVAAGTDIMADLGSGIPMIPTPAFRQATMIRLDTGIPTRAATRILLNTETYILTESMCTESLVILPVTVTLWPS